MTTTNGAPSRPYRERISPRTGLLLLAALALFLNLYRLESYPAPWVDEGWIAEVAAVASRGDAPGNPSHGTLYRFHDRLFWMPPLYFFVLGAWFSVFPVDLITARILNGALGLLTVLLVYEYGRRRIGATAAFLAGLVLLFEPFAWKAFRTVRFESLVTLLGFALIVAVDRALDAAGLLLNVHPNGALFWVAALALVLARRGPRALARRGPWLALGAALLLVLPTVAYFLTDAAQGFENVRGQNSYHWHTGASRAPALREWTRYAGFFPWPVRTPAAIAAVAVLAAALANARHPFTRAMLVPPAVIATGLLFLPNKTLLYLVPLVPFLALLAADWWRRGRSRAALAALAVLLASGAAVEAGLLHRNRDCDARRAFAKIRGALEPDDRVAGTFVTWWAAWPRPFHEFSRGATLEAVAAFSPTVVLIGDRQWAQEVRTRFGPLGRDLDREFALRGRRVGDAGDSCLGQVAIWRFAE